MQTGANIDKMPRITYLSTASHISLKNSCIKTENATININGSSPLTPVNIIALSANVVEAVNASNGLSIAIKSSHVSLKSVKESEAFINASKGTVPM